MANAPIAFRRAVSSATGAHPTRVTASAKSRALPARPETMLEKSTSRAPTRNSVEAQGPRISVYMRERTAMVSPPEGLSPRRFNTPAPSM